MTYSQADLAKCPTRDKFADMVVSEFNAVTGEDVVDQWACALEKHKKEGIHYHLSLKIKKRRRFAAVRGNIKRNHGIDVNFQEWATFYYDCFTYVTKEDPQYILSQHHTPLENSPLTKAAVNAKKHNTTNTTSTSSRNTNTMSRKDLFQAKAKKQPRLDISCFYQLVIANNIHSDLELCGLSLRQMRDGKTDLNRFIMSRSEKQRLELINTAWKIDTSLAKIERSKKIQYGTFT